MREETEGERPKLPQNVVILGFLLVVGLALVGWVWFSGRSTSSSEPQATVVAGNTRVATAAAPAAGTDVPGDGFGIVAGLATPWAVPGGPGEPTVTPEPIPTQPAKTINLIGPPPESFFRAGDVVTFYWNSPEPLGPDQRFIVYVLDDGDQVFLGSVSEVNLGVGYQLSAIIGQSVEETGRFSWLVVLEDEQSGAIIGQSETRSIALIDDN